MATKAGTELATDDIDGVAAERVSAVDMLCGRRDGTMEQNVGFTV